MTDTEYWVINGHREDCSYIRSLDDICEGVDRCDCGEDDDGPVDEEEEW